jgi:arylsulfatase A-like enzyme
MVRLIDQELGRILQCLDELELTENTMIIFTTDHGELLGDHGLWMKGPFHYENLVRIPMIFSWPKGMPSGTRINGLISQVDIAPTILAATGCEGDRLDGFNLLPLLREEVNNIRDQVFIETVDDPNHLRLKTIVTKDRKLTFYHQQPFGELYDLNNDPGELINHWDDSVYTIDRLTLLARLLDHAERLELSWRADRVGYA